MPSIGTLPQGPHGKSLSPGCPLSPGALGWCLLVGQGGGDGSRGWWHELMR